MDRVTLVLCTNATRTHTLPVAMLSEAVRPLCFRGVGNEFPLPYFSQHKAWMDKHVHAPWFNTVFLPAVRARHGGEKCALILENPSTHDTALSEENFEMLFLFPSVTAIYQPMDAGVIAALKRRYKRRLLAVLARWSPVPGRAPPPPSAPIPHLQGPQPPPPTPGLSRLTPRLPPRLRRPLDFAPRIRRCVLGHRRTFRRTLGRRGRRSSRC